MTVWILMVHIMLQPGKPMPFLAFEHQNDCWIAQQALPEGTKSYCIAFAADAPNVK